MKPFFLLVSFFFALKMSGQVVVSGQVMGAGEPLVGASVVSKNDARRGATTDLDGKFRLELASANDFLVVSYAGFSKTEIEIGSKRAFEIELLEDASLLDEVIVVGYGSQKRSEISGSVSTITSEEISELPILRVEQALQGRSAGVQVSQNSGSPGSTMTVRIRGTGTINDSEPLYIVDGVPVGGLDFLNPNDIESMNILKDAASTAIYGARGANGVVLITTKTGKKNAGGKISFDSYTGQQSAWKTANLLSAREYAILSNEAHVAAGRSPLPEFSNPDALGEGTDWLGAVFQTAPISSHQIGFTGGSEKSSYTLTGNIFGQKGIVGGEKAGFRRQTVRANGSHEVRKWLTLGSNFGFTALTRNGLAENNEFVTPLARALNMDPITPVRKADGTFAYSRYADTDITNPLNAIEQTHDRWHSDRLVGSIFGELNLGRGFRFRSAASVDVTFAQQNIFFPKFDLSNDPVLSDAPGDEKRAVNSVVVNNNVWKNWQVENVLTYGVTLQKRHNLGLTAGTTALANRHEYNGGANTNLPSNDPKDAYISNTIDPITAQSAYGGASENALRSFFGRANYGLDEKYFVSATLRADGSSRFGANNRWGFFPSVSAAWNVSREDFWTGYLAEKVVTSLKIRASWGQNGNDRIGNYGFSTIVNSGQNYTFSPDQIITNGSVALIAANPDLRWESIAQTDLGLDAELFDGRFSFVADVYQKNTSGMLYAAPVPLTAGTAPPVRNVASVENRGLELALSYRNRDRAFKYSVGGNAAFVKNVVTGLGEGGEPVFAGRVQAANSDVTKTDVGHPIGAFFGFVTDGIFQNQAEIVAGPFQNEATAPGDLRFKDLDGDGKITISDQKYIGNPSPKATFGATVDFEFKGFDLGFFLQGSAGNDIYNATVRYDLTYVNRPNSVLNRWTGEGTSNSQPRVNLLDPNQNARVSDRFVEDGSYLRVKNAQLGYTVPRSLAEKGRFEKLRFYVSAQNLFTWTRYSGLDPEIGAYGGALNSGIDRGFYPQARVFLGGVNLVF